MSPLIIEPSGFSPKVVLDPAKNIFEFSGESRIENTRKFYTPILHWVEQYDWKKNNLGAGAARVFEFKFNYFNSSSAKFIMDVLMQLDKIAQEGCNVKAKWHYEKRNGDMKESGEEFLKLLKKLPLEFVEG